jgi:hypothetical protein
MAYGTIKVDTITFTDGGIDKSVSISGLVQNPTFTGNITVTGTVSGNTVRGQTISGVTITGTTAQFTSGTFVSLTGATLQGTTATYTTGSFTSLTGTTTSGTTANFVSGVFSTQISGATVTGTTANFTSGNFTNISGGTHTITSGVFAAGTAANPSISFTSDPNTGIYSPGADQVALATGGTGRLFVNSSGDLSIGTSTAGTKFHAVGGNVWSSNFFEVGRFQKSNGTGVSLGYDNTSYVASIGAYSHDGTASSLSFWTYPGTGNLLERMRLDSSGRLGLGTSSPNALLEANGGDIWMVGANGRIYLQNGNTSGGAKIGVRGTSATSNGYLAFETNDIEFARFDSSGRLGIGTTSPAEAFTLGSGNAQITSGQLTVGVTSTSGLQFINDGTLGTLNSIPLILRTASAERARIDTSGRLLVGTSTARSNFYNDTNSARFQVEGTDNDGAAIAVVQNFAANTIGAQLILAKSNLTSVGSNTLVAAGDRCGNISFQGNDGAQFVEAAAITGVIDGTPGANDMPGRLVFSTTADGASSPTERMRISSGGQVFIGTTSGNSSYQVIVGGDAPGGGAGGIYVSCDGVGDANYLSASDNIGFHFYSAGASSKFFYVENDGDVRNTNNSYGAISDLKLKQDIEDAGSQWNDLKAVQVKKFRFKSNPDDALHIGVIAQELESVSPGLIDETIDRDQEGNDLGTVTKSVKYSVLYMKAVKALQEAMERIETLEAKVAALEAQ